MSGRRAADGRAREREQKGRQAGRPAIKQSLYRCGGDGNRRRREKEEEADSLASSLIQRDGGGGPFFPLSSQQSDEDFDDDEIGSFNERRTTNRSQFS